VRRAHARVGAELNCTGRDVLWGSRFTRPGKSHFWIGSIGSAGEPFAVPVDTIGVQGER
jgi:hypothetical protein